MTNVAKIDDTAQGVYVPTPAEVRAAIIHEVCDAMEGENGAEIPTRIFAIIDRGLARANAGEFQ